jgi:hypothetical protein
MATVCRQENCTVAETGVCLLNNEPAKCPNLTAELDSQSLLDVAAEVAPPLVEPPKNPRFPLSLTLTPDQTSELMSRKYCHLVGILGAPDAGKTAALVSLYLLIARDRLNGFSFADSRSLRAFDDLSQGARRWNEGKVPDQMTAHTELPDDRSAGFLHLRLKVEEQDKTVDLLLPDLPGEWTTAMLDNSRVDRLEFLKRSDVIWLMVDGRQFAKANTRQLILHRTKLMLQKLAGFLKPAPPIKLVLTRRDSGEPDTAALESLHAEARSRGLDMEVLLIASFSEGNGFTPGHGIAELIAATCKNNSQAPQFWSETQIIGEEERAMFRFRSVKEN